jgi:hypothetical protein
MINPPSTNFAEQWVKQYTQLNQAISYKSFDFNGIKRSLIEYLRTYHPEHFNNLTETDELLPLIELFAYVGELYAYRADVNTQEHILSSATRKSSAIQIANMLGYTPSRRTAGVGLVKLTSVSTTESVLDTSGVNLQRKVIKWVDQTNARWKPQFDMILGRVLNSSTGVLSDTDKTQVENITFERYTMNTSDLVNGVFKFTTSVNGVAIPMEVVGTQLSDNSISELSPTGDRPLDILYANDGFGDSSPTSGYMFLVKQGVLAAAPIQFDGGTVNLTQPVNAQGINDTDLWLTVVDADGKYISSWGQVDNIAYNSSTSREVYQVLSMEGDQVTLVFGDGNYSTIPSGSFKIWYRTSLELDSSIPTSAITNQSLSIEYLDSYGNNQTFTCTFSLQSAIVTSSASETLAKLKQAVPGVFYTQDRMVNAQDHQTYLLQDPSVVKVKAVNRTFAGHSKYSSWYDGSENYDNIKIFSNDGVLHLADAPKLIEVLNPASTISYIEFVTQNLTAALNYPELWTAITQQLGVTPTIRMFFTQSETVALTTALQQLASGGSINMYWDVPPAAAVEGWVISTNNTTRTNIQVSLLSSSQGWLITLYTSKLIIHSASTRFWQYSSVTGMDYDTLNPTADIITILKANPNRPRSGTLSTDVPFQVSGNITLQTALPNQASLDLSKVELVDTVPISGVSGLLHTEFKFQITSTTTNEIVLPSTYIVGYGDIISVVGHTTTGLTLPLTFTENSLSNSSPAVGTLFQKIVVAGYAGVSIGGTVTVTMRDWVYFQRADATQPYVSVPATDSAKLGYVSSRSAPNPTSVSVIRYPGRDGLNFLWQHFTDQFELINPARTNITDLYVVTKQYFTDFTRWLQGLGTIKPSLPSVLQLSTAYSKYMQKAMMSDELIMRPGKFKILFGPKSEPTLRATIQIVIASGQQVAKDVVKQEIVTLTRQYFDISNVEFGDTFYFSNLSSFLHSSSKYSLGSVLLVPLYPGYQFGDLYELTAAPDEIFVADISLSDIQVVDQLTSTNIRM